MTSPMSREAGTGKSLRRVGCSVEIALAEVTLYRYFPGHRGIDPAHRPATPLLGGFGFISY